MASTLTAGATTLSCPYPGLRPFRADEAVVFFGRDEQVDQLLERLGSRRFLAVVGTSGCGKSSLVQAGLIPALRTGLLGSAGTRWAVACMRPGDRPLWHLAKALLDEKVLGPAWSELDHPIAQLHAALQRGPLGLAEVLDETPLPDGRKLLLLVDQFEELFRYRREGEGQRDEANAFVALLLTTARQIDRPVYIVLTMRSDYLGDCALFEGLPEALNDSQFLTPRLTRDQRRQAIEGPARVFDGRVEPALVTRLLNDMGSGPDQLPLMQHALMRLWKGCAPASDGAVELTLTAYEALGGLEGALSGQADAAYESMDPGQKWVAEVLFRRLSERTTAGRDIRRPTRLREVADIVMVGPEAVLGVVDLLRDPERCFLTPPWPREIGPDDTLDISHESLIRHWGRLRDWVDKEAESAEFYRRLDQTARLWSEGRAGLWGSPDLDQALRWKEEARPNGAWADRYGGDFARAIRFLGASMAERATKQAEEQRRVAERVERSLAEAERQKAEAERQKRFNRILTIAAGVLLLLAVVAGVQTRRADWASKVAMSEARNAKQARDDAEKNAASAKQYASIATSRQLAALSTSERDTRLDLSLLLSVEALRTSNTFEARNSLYNALRDRPGIEAFLHSREGFLYNVAFDPDGKALAAGYSGGVILWDVATRRRLSEHPLQVEEGDVRSVAFSPDGKVLAAGFARNGGGVVLWDVAAQRRLTERPLPVTEGDVYSVAFSPDRRTLAAGFAHGDGGVILWDVPSRHRLTERPLPVAEGEARSVAFSPDGKVLAAGYGRGSDGGVVLWDVPARRRLAAEPLRIDQSDVWSVAFSPDGQALAAGCGVGLVSLWDMASRGRPENRVLPGYEGVVGSVAFSPDGKVLAAGYARDGVGGVALWDVAARRRQPDRVLPVQEGEVLTVAFNPASKALALGYARAGNGGVILWDPAARDRLADRPLPVREGEVLSVAFSPVGRALATGFARGDGTGGVALWDVAARRPLADQPLLVKEGYVWSVAFSPDGKALAAGFARGVGIGGVVLWDATARGRLVDQPLPADEGEARSVAFSPDGQTLAAGLARGDGTGGVVLWNVAARRRLASEPLRVDEGRVLSVAFSPDGKALATGYARGSGGSGVVLWNVATRRRLVDQPLPMKEGDVWSVAFSPDGQALAAGYRSGSVSGVVLWDVPTRRRLSDEPIAWDQGSIWSLAFCPDGQTLAAGFARSGGVGGSILWDVAARRRLSDEPLPVDEGEVTSVAFSPDGQALATGYRGAQEGGVILWDMEIESWKRRAARIANRNFTREEWHQYLPDEPYHPTFPELPVPPEVPSNDATGGR